MGMVLAGGLKKVAFLVVGAVEDMAQVEKIVAGVLKAVRVERVGLVMTGVVADEVVMVTLAGIVKEVMVVAAGVLVEVGKVGLVGVDLVAAGVEQMPLVMSQLGQVLDLVAAGVGELAPVAAGV